MPNKAMLAMGLVGLGFISLILFSMHQIGPMIAILAIAIIWVSSLPGIIYLAYPGNSAVPIFPLHCMFYAFFFGLPVFLISIVWPDAASIAVYSVPVPEIHIGVFATALAGVTALAAVFYILRPLIRRIIPPFRFPDWVPASPSRLLLWILMAGHFLVIYVPTVKSLPSVGQVLVPAGFVALGGFYLLWRRGAMPAVEALAIVCICVPMEIYWRIRLIFLTDVMLFLIFFLLLFWRERQFKLISACIIAGMLTLSIYGVSTKFREDASAGFGRISVVAEAFFRLIVKGEDEYDLKGIKTAYLDDGRWGALIRRISGIWVFHIVDDRSPEPVPYLGGKSYKPLLTSFIPRAIYAGKPQERFGNEFGKQFGFLNSGQVHTSVNVPWITELRANFGRVGVVIGMAVFGILLAFLDRVFNARKMTDTEFLVGLTLLFPLTYPESNFTVMTGSLLPLFLSLYVYFLAGGWALGRFASWRGG